METQASKFIISREDLNVDPVALVTDGLKIGRLPSCELVLNHPTVSRLHAGIKEVGGAFYIFSLTPSNSTTVNGRLVEEREAIADGDIVQIGPFFLYVGRSGKEAKNSRLFLFSGLFTLILILIIYLLTRWL